MSYHVPGQYSGGSAAGYSWTQTLHEVCIRAPLPPEGGAASCKFFARRLEVSWVGGAESPVPADRELNLAISPEATRGFARYCTATTGAAGRDDAASGQMEAALNAPAPAGGSACAPPRLDPSPIGGGCLAIANGEWRKAIPRWPAREPRAALLLASRLPRSSGRPARAQGACECHV